MKHMTLAEIETILAAEGLTAMSMTHYDSRESEGVRTGKDGEYELHDYMDAGNNPEAAAIIDQLLDWGDNFLKDEYAVEEGCSGVSEEEEAPRKKLAWLKRR